MFKSINSESDALHKLNSELDALHKLNKVNTKPHWFNITNPKESKLVQSVPIILRWIWYRLVVGLHEISTTLVVIASFKYAYYKNNIKFTREDIAIVVITGLACLLNRKMIYKK